MARAWTDGLVTPLVKRKKAHITEMHDAYEERIRFLDQIYASGIPSPDNWGYKTISSVNKDWNVSSEYYPKAEPTYWPPNHLTNNLYRNEHIYAIRNSMPGFGCTYRSMWEDQNVISWGGGWKLPQFSISPHDDYYRPYHAEGSNGEHGLNLLENVGAGEDATELTDDDLTAGSVEIRACHIAELQKCFEECSIIHVPPTKVYIRWKWGSGKNDIEYAAWNAAITDFNSSSWEDWIDITLLDPDDFDYRHWRRYGESPDINYYLQAGILGWVHEDYNIGRSGGDYQFVLLAQEVKFEFDLDLEIYADPAWPYSVFPPVSAKLCVAGYCGFQLEGSDASFVLWNQAESITGATEITITTDTYLECTTLSKSVEVPQEDAALVTINYGGESDWWHGKEELREGYLFEEDITDDVGSGHGSEEYAFTVTDWEDAFDDIRPSTPADGESIAQWMRSFNTAPNVQQDGISANHAGLCYVVIEPDWRFGRAT